MGIFGCEVPDDTESLIIFIINTKEYLIVRVLLGECGFQILVEIRFKAFERS